MRDLPINQLNPKIKNVWRISDGAWLTVLFLACLAVFGFILLSSGASWAAITLIVIFVLYVIALVVWLIVIPPIRFIRWRYELSPEYLDIALGIIWRKRFIIPFIRVQNTDTRQGPILRLFGLSSVTISTAGGDHVIPGLGVDEAEQLRDRAAEFARLAREDV